MEGIIVVVGIIIAIVNAINKGKTVKKNAPGQATRPQQPVQPPFQSAHRARYEQMKTPVEPARPTVQPTVTPAAPSDDFWKQITALMEPEEETAVKGHEQVTAMPEGDSRECDHGSVGGSMAYSKHQGGSAVAAQKREAFSSKQYAQTQQTADTLYRPARSAQEMRQAVVMAEILKRPQERMAEQARRWSAR